MPATKSFFIALIAAFAGLAIWALPSPATAQESTAMIAPTETPATKIIVMAGGCFWCMESPFDAIDGVISTVSGYSGGHLDNPSYKDVSSGASGHIEVLQVTYDPAKVTLDRLLDVFWRNIDPLDSGGQFCDRGDQYRSALFYANESEKAVMEASKSKHEALIGSVFVTEIIAAAPFYAAEDYHQDYYQRNPVRYKYYRYRCGRDERLQELWSGK